MLRGLPAALRLLRPLPLRLLRCLLFLLCLEGGLGAQQLLWLQVAQQVKKGLHKDSCL